MDFRAVRSEHHPCNTEYYHEFSWIYFCKKWSSPGLEKPGCTSILMQNKDPTKDESLAKFNCKKGGSLHRIGDVLFRKRGASIHCDTISLLNLTKVINDIHYNLASYRSPMHPFDPGSQNLLRRIPYSRIKTHFSRASHSLFPTKSNKWVVGSCLSDSPR